MTIAELLSKTKADDYFIVNIRKGRERIYFGYAHEVADEVAVMKIESIYIDWASEALGIKVIE